MLDCSEMKRTRECSVRRSLALIQCFVDIQQITTSQRLNSPLVAGVEDLYRQKTLAESELIIYVKVVDEAHSLRGDAGLIFTLSDQERAYFYETFENICDEIYIEKVVPQWAETQLDRQNSVSETGMYDQKIRDWKDICPFTFMYLHFNCDGTVSPCTLDWPRKVVIGDAKTESIYSIWHGSKLRELQIAQIMGQRKCIEFCGSCSAPMVCVEEDPHIVLPESTNVTEPESLCFSIVTVVPLTGVILFTNSLLIKIYSV